MKEDSKKLSLELAAERPNCSVTLGKFTSYDYMTDPKHFVFVGARYKFCAQMLAGMNRVLEVGCGDGFGSAIVADTVENLLCVDINEPLLEENRKRNDFLENVSYECFDFRIEARQDRFDGIFLVDVLEHIYPSEEEPFLSHIVESLSPHGTLIIGTPNAAADRYASTYSQRAHVNTKTFKALKVLCDERFHHVFLFGMNDEVLHTGYPAMCHYLWALCVEPKSP